MTPDRAFCVLMGIILGMPLCFGIQRAAEITVLTASNADDVKSLKARQTAIENDSLELRSTVRKLQSERSRFQGVVEFSDK